MSTDTTGHGGAPTEHGGGKFVITFVINGEDVPVEVEPHQKLETARNKALEESRNTGRPPNDWEVRTDSGLLLDASKTIAELGIKPGARLLLSLKIGAGGT